MVLRSTKLSTKHVIRLNCWIGYYIKPGDLLDRLLFKDLKSDDSYIDSTQSITLVRHHISSIQIK